MALLLTFIILLTLTTISVAFLYMTSIQLKASAADIATQQALWLTEAGLNKAIWYLLGKAPDPVTSHDGSWRTDDLDGDSVNDFAYLSSNANSGQADVVVDDGSIFSANDTVLIKDANNGEINTISSINGNTLTMQNNLENTYTTANAGTVNLGYTSDPSLGNGTYAIWVPGFSLPGGVWTYCKKVTIDYEKVPNTDQNNFPVLINTTDAVLKDTANDGYVAQSDGGDILFTDAAGNKLDHEIEKYTPSTGELIVWVEVPTVSASTDTIIYMYYGNASCADQWNVTGTWDEGGSGNFKGVWHLKENPTGGATPDGSDEIFDSTSNDNDGNTGGSMDSNDQVAGQVNGSLDFDGTDDYVNLGTTLLNNPDAGTVGMWIYPTANGESNDRKPYWNTTILNKGLVYEAIQQRSDNKIRIYFYDGIGWAWLDSIGSVTLNQWNYITYTWNAAGSTIYIAGDQDVTSETKTWADYHAGQVNQQLDLGGYTIETLPYYFSGTIDEARVSDTVRSADWISTCYNNQKYPDKADYSADGFYTVGTEVTIYARGTASGLSRIITQSVVITRNGFVLDDLEVAVTPQRDWDDLKW
ncbi:MAG: DUF2341 domain-containing protein [Candidatus Omnitrophica bacterium]|nr:DUF2341 domain-containing protein [Candidatus Omnitrophota bacterium]